MQSEIQIHPPRSNYKITRSCLILAILIDMILVEIWNTLAENLGSIMKGFLRLTHFQILVSASISYFATQYIVKTGNTGTSDSQGMVGWPIIYFELILKLKLPKKLPHLISISRSLFISSHHLIAVLINNQIDFEEVHWNGKIYHRSILKESWFWNAF